MGRIIRKTFDQCKPTPAEIERLAALAERPDSEIDLSDIPELDEKFWKNAVRNPFYEKLMQSRSNTRKS
ncbi:MAG: hypothetical protein WBD46_17640 [Acidobacteriaceae bacterium]